MNMAPPPPPIIELATPLYEPEGYKCMSVRKN
jgi:hypothetical protein